MSANTRRRNYMLIILWTLTFDRSNNHSIIFLNFIIVIWKHQTCFYENSMLCPLVVIKRKKKRNLMGKKKRKGKERNKKHLISSMWYEKTWPRIERKKKKKKNLRIKRKKNIVCLFCQIFLTLLLFLKIHHIQSKVFFFF